MQRASWFSTTTSWPWLYASIYVGTTLSENALSTPAHYLVCPSIEFGSVPSANEANVDDIVTAFWLVWLEFLGFNRYRQQMLNLFRGVVWLLVRCCRHQTVLSIAHCPRVPEVASLAWVSIFVWCICALHRSREVWTLIWSLMQTWAISGCDCGADWARYIFAKRSCRFVGEIWWCCSRCDQQSR